MNKYRLAVNIIQVAAYIIVLPFLIPFIIIAIPIQIYTWLKDKAEREERKALEDFMRKGDKDGVKIYQAF